MRGWTLALALMMGCGAPVAVPKPRQPPASPIAPEPAPGKPARSTSIRTRSQVTRCGARQEAVVEGVADDGTIAWIYEAPSTPLALTLPDGGGLVHLDPRGEPVSMRFAPDGTVMWVRRWPVPVSTMSGPSRRVDGPDPRTLRALTSLDERLFFWFEDEASNGFGVGIDLWAFDLAGQFVERTKMPLAGHGTLLVGYGSLFLDHENRGMVYALGFDGKVRQQAKVDAPVWLEHTKEGLDAVIGGGRVITYDVNGEQAWSFGSSRSIVSSHAPAWGGLLLITAACEAIQLDGDGRPAWRRLFAEDECSAGLRFASIDTAVVITRSRWQQPTLAYALSASGDVLFRQEVQGKGSTPIIEDGKATVEQCVQGGEVHELPPLVATITTPGGTPALPVWRSVEVEAVKMLDVPVQSLAVSSARDASALSGDRLWRFDGSRWRDTGQVRSTLVAPQRDGVVFGDVQVDAIFAGPNALWASVYRDGLTKPEYPGALQYRTAVHGGIANRHGGGLRELVATRAAFTAELEGDRTDGIALTTVLAGATSTLLCHARWCKRLAGKQVTDIQLPGPLEVADMAWVGGGAWAIGSALVRFDGDTAVEIDGTVTPPPYGAPSAPRLWGSAANDVWWLDTALHRFDGTKSARVEVPVAAVRDVGGTGPDDVWLVGDDGVAHFDGTEWARVVGMGVTSLSRVEVHDGVVWLAGPSGVFRVEARGHHLTPASRVEATRAEGSTPVTPRSVTLNVESVTLRPPGRSVVGAYEVAAKDGTLWVRDDAGVVAFDGVSTRTLLARKDVGGWTCHQCLAPDSPRTGWVLGGAMFAVNGATTIRRNHALDHMLSVVSSGARVVVGGGTQRAGAPLALEVMAGVYDWAVPEGCYAAAAAHQSETWLAGGTACASGDTLLWPKGEGVLVHRTPSGVRTISTPNGPLLGVVAVGPHEAWAVGELGQILHVEGDTVRRFQIAGQPRLRAVAYDGRRAWFAGDDRTLLRTADDGFERIPIPGLFERASIGSLAFRGAELWLASVEGLFRITP